LFDLFAFIRRALPSTLQYSKSRFRLAAPAQSVEQYNVAGFAAIMYLPQMVHILARQLSLISARSARWKFV